MSYGHTLVELLVAIPTVAILILIFIQFHLVTADGLSTINAQTLLQAQLTQGMHRILQDARMANGLGNPCPGIGGTTFAPTTDSTCFQLASVDTQGQALSPVTWDLVSYQFNQTAGTLSRIVKKAGASARINSEQTLVNDLQAPGGAVFQAQGGAVPSAVTCTLSGRRVERGRPYFLTLVVQARFRNFKP